jgi:hypothetical protein
MHGYEQMTKEKYDLFVSYNKADVEFVERLVKAVESARFENRKLRCFYDSWDIAPGENILLRIEEGLTNSRFIGLIISPDWLKSDWTTLERVIPVHEDPAGLKGRIIPILRRNCNIPPSIKILKWLDFRSETNFNRELRKLLNRLIGLSERKQAKADDIAPVYSYDSINPDVQREVLVSNLFQVLSVPSFVSKARAVVKNRSGVWDLLGEGITLPIFAIREESAEIFSFCPFTDAQRKLGRVAQDQTYEKVPTVAMLQSEYFPILIELLNRAMTEHMRGIGMVYDWKSKKTFFPIENEADTSRFSNWKVGKREFRRFIVKKSKNGRFFVHRSCKATFTKIRDQLFLKIIPGWHFTIDGLLQPVSKTRMGSLSAKYMNIQRNHGVLDEIRFWINKLSKTETALKLNVGVDELVLIATSPLSASINKGIIEDYHEKLWAEEPERDETEKIDDEETEDDIFLVEEDELK